MKQKSELELSLYSRFRPSPFGDRCFHWVETGKGPETVIFLHGIMAHSMAFRFVLKGLGPGFRILAPDLPAHGRDETFRDEAISADLSGLLTWLEGLLDTLDGAPVHIVGHSLGATLTYLAALSRSRFPQIQTLTLVSPGLKIRVPSWTSALLSRFPPEWARLGIHRRGIRLYEPLQWRRARMSAAEVRDYLTPIQDPLRMAYMLRLGAELVAREHSIEDARSIENPTLLIWGDRDLLLPLPTAYELSRQIPDSQLEIFTDCGHCPMEDYPEKFSREIQDFLLRKNKGS